MGATSFSTHLNGPLSGTTRVSRYEKGKTNLEFTGARDSESQWHQLGHMQDCTSLQADNHASTTPLSFLQTGCPSCRPTNSVKALKAQKQAKKQAINDKLQGSVATYLRYDGFKSVNIWQSYKQERRRLMHFVRLATTLLKDKESG